MFRPFFFFVRDKLRFLNEISRYVNPDLTLS